MFQYLWLILFCSPVVAKPGDFLFEIDKQRFYETEGYNFYQGDFSNSDFSVKYLRLNDQFRMEIFSQNHQISTITNIQPNNTIEYKPNFTPSPSTPPYFGNTQQPNASVPKIKIKNPELDNQINRPSETQTSAETYKFLGEMQQMKLRNYKEEISKQNQLSGQILPKGHTQEEINSLMEPYFKSAGNPPQTAQAIYEIVDQARLQYPKDDSLARFILSSFLSSTNIDGIFKNLPLVENINVSLFSNPFSEEGNEIRFNLNSVLATESLLNLSCEGKVDPNCVILDKHLHELEFTSVVLDQLLQTGSKYAHDVLRTLKDDVSAIVNFTNVFVLNTSELLVSDLMLATELYNLSKGAAPGPLTYGLLEHLENFPNTLKTIRECILNNLNELLAGSAETNAKIASFIVAPFFPSISKKFVHTTLLTEVSDRVSVEILSDLKVEAKIAQNPLKGESNPILIPNNVRELLEKTKTFKGIDLDLVSQGREILRETHPEMSPHVLYDFMKKNPNKTDLQIFLSSSKDAINYAGNISRLHSRNQINYGASVDDLLRISNNWQTLNEKMSHLTPVSLNVALYRATDTSYFLKALETGSTVEQAGFAMSPSNLLNDHRYSIPGQKALYTFFAPDPNKATYLAAKEMNSYNLESYRIVSKSMRLDGVLDLTDSSTLHKLSINPDSLISRRNEVSSYELTHQLGDIARKNGFWAIIAPSAEVPGGANLILLRPGYDEIFRK